MLWLQRGRWQSRQHAVTVVQLGHYERQERAAEELHVAAFLDACFLMLHVPVVLMKTLSTSIGMHMNDLQSCGNRCSVYHIVTEERPGTLPLVVGMNEKTQKLTYNE